MKRSPVDRFLDGVQLAAALVLTAFGIFRVIHGDAVWATLDFVIALVLLQSVRISQLSDRVVELERGDWVRTVLR